MTKLRVFVSKKVSPNNCTIFALVNYLPKNDAVKVEFKDDNVAASIEGQEITGISAVARFLVRSFPESNLYGSDGLNASVVDYWVDFADVSLNTSNFQALNSALQEMNIHLKMRSYFAGYHVTLADLCVFGALRSSTIWLKISRGKDAPSNLLRWYSHISALPEIDQAIKMKPSVDSSANAKKDQASFDIDLPGASDGNVCTRFPPEPSGYLHIGHAKAALLNQYFARHYKGRLIVRFDDTNPSKEKAEFEESILEDLKMLDIHGDALTWTSDYFDQIYQYALHLINENLAYVDDTPQEAMREERMHGIASKNRDLSVEENLKRFEEMKNATELGLTCCLRAKMSVDAKNKALRDPVIYRCNILPHNRTGDKWKMYPTYDFACPIVDSVEGVTHALRTTEYHDRNDQYYWFINALKIRRPHIWDYSRVNFVYTLLSKRKLQWFVDNNLVTGWDDPRFPTVRGILRRGMTVEALKKYILMQGPSKNNLLLEWDKLWSLNKQVIDPVSPRYCALARDNLVRVHLVDGPSSAEEKEVLKHKKNPDLGYKKTVYYKQVLLEGEDGLNLIEGEEVTFMDWGNVIVSKVTKTADTVEIEAKLHLEGDFKKTKKKLTWLSETDSLVPTQLLDFDYLITKKKLEENDSFEDCVNPETEFVVEALGDANLKTLKKGDIIQLERKGYYIVDQAFDGPGTPIKLLNIPDGKASSISLKAKEVK